MSQLLTTTARSSRCWRERTNDLAKAAPTIQQSARNRPSTCCSVSATVLLRDGTVMRQVVFSSLLLVLLFRGYAAGQQNQTLGDVLKQMSVPIHSGSVSHLNEPITSYATLNTDREFLVAYYLISPGNELNFPLFLMRFDKRSGEWQEASLTDLKVKISEETEPDMQVDLHRCGREP